MSLEMKSIYFRYRAETGENKMTELEGCADSCLRKDASKIILIINVTYDEE